MAHGVSSLSQQAVAADRTSPPETNWELIDAELSCLLAPTEFGLASNDISPEEAGDIFSSLLSAHLEKHNLSHPHSSSNALVRRSRRIERVTERLRQMKNSSRNLLKSSPAEFHQLVRAHNIAKKGCMKLSNQATLRRNERAFRSNPWHFAKSVCSERVTQENALSCSSKDAYSYFSSSFNEVVDEYESFPPWISTVIPPVDDVVDVPFNLSPITPRQIKGFLKKRSSNSTPGDDKISYHALKKLPSIHHFLATLFSKILLSSQKPPSSWCTARILPIHKKGNSVDPANFRPIALTSAVGKLFHAILSSRLEKYAIANKFLDSSVQKGFLKGINGCIEHIFSIQQILCNAKQHSRPLSLTFIDLKNAFGSVSHKYILDILSHIKVPLQLQQYIKNLYSSLSAYIHTKEWSTPTFPIKRGVFQGDTLSPLLFLIAFNPILQALCIHPSKGFSLLIEKETQVSPSVIPKIGSYVYALWNEYRSDEKPGWYLAKVCSVSDEGETILQYKAGGRIEKVAISEICWAPAKGNGKWFLPPSTTLPSIPMTPAKLSKDHKVKAYADDLTIITENPVDHQLVLSFANDKCRDIGLTIRPDKCFSLVTDGKSVTNATFTVGDGHTSNINDHPTAFLGSTVCHNACQTKRTASESFDKLFTSILSRLDRAKIRGEYKVWIYKRYLVPSLHFKLSVNPISTQTIKKANALATKCIKSWLGLTRSTTVAVLHHPDVLGIPFLKNYSTKAKLSYLSAVMVSKDPVIEEIAILSSSPAFSRDVNIPVSACNALQLAVGSIKEINRVTLPKSTRAIQVKIEREHWNSHLHKLTVQKKFSDVCVLERDTNVWSRIMGGLPAGQLSFILRAASDTLPTPLNLARWRYKTDSSCNLCRSPTPTTLHILNACPVSLFQGRYTWRHDSVLNKIILFLQQHLAGQGKLYGDLDGFRVTNNPPTTVPPNILITSARPDIVFVGVEKNLIILELTIPFNSPESMKKANNIKTNKYELLLSDLECNGYTPKFLAMEIGALGHHQPGTPSALHNLFPSIPKNSFRTLLDNAGKTAISTSRRIFMARREESWSNSQPLL